MVHTVDHRVPATLRGDLGTTFPGVGHPGRMLEVEEGELRYPQVVEVGSLDEKNKADSEIRLIIFTFQNLNWSQNNRCDRVPAKQSRKALGEAEREP